MRRTRLPAHEILVVGGSAKSEIAAGNRLGMVTVQIRRYGVPPIERARHRIRSCAELPALLDAPRP